MEKILANMRIWKKAALPLALMAIAAIGISVFQMRGTAELDAGYTKLVAHDAEAVMWTSRANTTAVDTARLAWRVIGQPGLEDKRKALGDVAENQKVFAERLGRARKLVPELDAEWAVVEAEMAVAFQSLAEAGAHAIGGRQAAALEVMEKKQLPAIATARAALRKAIETLDATMDKHSAALSAEAESSRTLTIAVVAVSILVTSLIGAWVAMRGIAMPIGRMTDAMAKLASGDKTAEISGRGRKDEIGKMIEAVQTFKDNMIAAERLEAEQREAEEKQKKEQAERQRLAEERAQRMDDLTQNFDKAVNEVLGGVTSGTAQLEASAQSLTANAEETSRQSTAVAAASEEATNNVQSVASATEELTSSITEINRQVSKSSEIARQAVEQAQQTNDTVKGLAEAAQKVGEVVNLINEIASQTNLLALNATIEAARAGDAGKGFAVVAAEVKTLANSTAKATEEIAAQVAAIQAATGGAVKAIEEIGATIGEISQISATVAAAVEEQGAATQEIARNVEQAAAGTRDVSSNIATVSEASGSVGSAAAQVLAAAQSMSKQAETLKREVGTFLEGVKAA